MNDKPKSRAEQIREEYGANAQQVPKYKPNRKQKRAQEAAHQKQLAAKKRGK